MEVYALGEPSGAGLSAGMQQALAKLVGSVGTPNFEPELFALANAVTGCAHVTAFASAPGMPPRVVLAVDGGRAGAARQVAARYLSAHWRLDPVNRLPVATQAAPRGFAARLAPRQIQHGDYRRECYTDVRLVDRFSLICPADAGLIRLNFYNASSRGRFAMGEIDVMAGASAMLLALVARHARDAAPASVSYTVQAERLRLVAPGLTQREEEVCLGVARGMTSEAIALDLGISLNTVLTYRKRAYARLGITSQNELFRLILR